MVNHKLVDCSINADIYRASLVHDTKSSLYSNRNDNCFYETSYRRPKARLDRIRSISENQADCITIPGFII